MDNLARATTTPDIKELLQEYTRSGNQQLRSRAILCESTRYAYWDDQAEDGKKHDAEGKRAFPFDKASDTRIRLADEIVNDNVDALEAGFVRAQFSAEGIEARDAQMAGAVSKALEWARNGGIPGLRDEAHYMADYGMDKGWCVLHVIWERRVARRYQVVTMEQLEALAEQNKDGPLAQMLLAIRNPDLETEAANMMRALYPDFVRMLAPGILPSEIPDLKLSRAKSAVRDLRSDARTQLPVPYVRANNPMVTTLEPYEEVFFPPETTDLQRARVIFRTDWMSESEIRAKVLSDGWNEDWAEAVIKTAGAQGSVTTTQNQQVLQQITGDQSQSIEGRKNMCEVVWAYTRQVDDDDVECIYYTVFSPHVKDSQLEQDYAVHAPLDYAHGMMPFVPYRREKPKRKVTSSRGVPEIVFTWQIEKKTQRDALFDRTSLSISPPLKVPSRNMGKVYRLAPMQQVGVQRSDELEWMEPPPGNPAEAIELIREIGMDANNYFGRISEGVDPVRAQIKMQNMTDQFLLTWVEVFKQVFALMTQYLSPAEWEEITGTPTAPRSWELLQRGYDWRLKFDVRDLNTDFMLAKLKAFNEFILPADAAGVIDRAKLTTLIAAWVDPTLAQAVSSDTTSASNQLYNKVQNDIALMALGNEVLMVENDPTSGRQLQYAQQIIGGNPKYQQQLQQDPQFKRLLETWTKNKVFNQQQQQNKQIGRIGVQTDVQMAGA